MPSVTLVAELDTLVQADVVTEDEEHGDPGDHDALLRAIDLLPGAQKQAVVLLKLHEMSLKEASALTGMTVGALKVATHRALKSLRRALQRPNGPGAKP